MAKSFTTKEDVPSALRCSLGQITMKYETIYSFHDVFVQKILIFRDYDEGLSPHQSMILLTKVNVTQSITLVITTYIEQASQFGEYVNLWLPGCVKCLLYLGYIFKVIL